MSTPWKQYQRDLASGNILPDPVQAECMHALDKLYERLLHEVNRRRSIMPFVRKPQTIKGCYLWGDVGTGKSYLLNTFFHSLPFTQKKRIHFHEFMQQVHEQLRDLQGEIDPLKKLAKKWAKNIYILCLDEFLVKDIADAMILANLLQALFSAGVCLVTTANIPPQNLYQGGLQRERFLPAIKLLEQHVTVLEVDNNVDYRRSETTTPSPYPFPQAVEGKLEKPLIINGRVIECVSYSNDTVWFRFVELCATCTGAVDYLAIAKQFITVIVSDIPVLTEYPVDAVLRFINLIDVLYDAHTQLIISAAVPIDELYTDGKLCFEFKRTASRLSEMQTQEYRDTVHET
ncbi:MAG: cell division protein ZapE [Gammaproteobacteria bacterium]|nr:cell division protein ZapE [Gammaproteobacteria bacterium]